MRIYRLTNFGKMTAARANNSQKGAAGVVLNHLKNLKGQASDDQLREYTGMPSSQLSSAIRSLQSAGIVEEIK